MLLLFVVLLLLNKMEFGILNIAKLINEEQNKAFFQFTEFFKLLQQLFFNYLSPLNSFKK